MTYTSLLNYRGLTSGGSPTAAVYAADFTTEIAGQTAVALSEKPPNSGNYNAQLTLSDSGGYIVVTDGSNIEVESYGLQNATQSALAVVDGVVDEILLDTAEIGTAGAGLTALPWNAAWDAEIESEVVDGLTVYTVPTTAQFEARTLLAANYFDSATDQVTVAANNDKTGYSLTQTFPTNFSALAIDGTGQVTSGNMRGTDNALLSTSYVVPPTTAEIEAALINEGDGQQLIDAILQVINANLDLPALELAAIASAVRSELTTELARLDVAVSTRLATGSYVAPLSAMDVRSAVGLASANLDTQLGDIPTVAEFNARTLPAADYFDPTADTVANVTTTTNLTNLPTIPTDWITSDGLASSAVTEIQTGLATSAGQSSILTGLNDIKGATFNGTTDSLEAIRDRGDSAWTTATGFSTHSASDVWAVGTRTVTGGTIDVNNDMRGTDNALLAANYIAPANSDISAIKAKTDQLTFTIANQVDANSLTGGGGDDSATIYSYFTDLNRADAFKADVSGLSVFDASTDTVTVGTNNDKTGYSLTQAFPTNFDILSINLSGQVPSSNMRGTDDALLAANYTAPDNTSISEILIDTGTTLPSLIPSASSIATAVEAALINEGDGQQLIDAILQVINANLDLPALELAAIASAVRSELATELARLDVPVGSRLAASSYVAPDNTSIASILTDTNELQTNWVDGGRLDLILDSRASQASVDGLNDLSQSDIRSAVGLATANLDIQLGDIPNNSEFNARTLPSADYFDPVNDPVDTVTNLTNLPSIPINWITSNGLDSSAVTEIQTNLATSANQTTILSDLTAIKSKTDQLTFTVANQVDANALTGDFGDDAATIYSYFTALTRADSFKADVSLLPTIESKIDSLDISTAISTALASYDGPTRVELSSDKTEILSAIAALPTPGDATLSNQLTILSNIGSLGQFESSDRTLLEEIHTFRHLNPSSPITTDKNGNITTETDGSITITHVLTPSTETVVSTRTG